ncbi:MAG TPA: type IV pilus secretin PilQ [Terriglobales bacterium]|nr:type IV pilus secretin PilQ [Terriglobales bacterium]
MRLKQLLGVFALLAILCTVTVAASSQLTNVSTSAKGNSTIVTVHANGSFTHNEYRPADNLLLVDMTGISPGKLQDKEQDLNLPGVKSYRVLSYKGASGTEVTRLEIALADANDVQVTETKGGLLLRVSGKGEASAAATAPVAPAPKVETAAMTPAPKVERAAMTAAPAPKPSAKATSPNVPEGMGSIRNIAVSHGASGLEVQIHGATSAKAMKLSNPDRVVLDFENSVPAVRTKNILVNSPELKDIRVGQFQNDPPVTRVVLDMKSAQEFEMVPGNGMLTVKFHGAAASSQPSPKQENVKQPEPAPAKPQLTQAVAQNATPAYAKPVGSSPTTSEEKPMAAKPAALQPASATPAQPAVFVDAKASQPAPSFNDANPNPSARAENAATTISKTNRSDESPMPATSAALGAQPAVNLALEQQQERAAATKPAGPRYTGEPISVNLKDVDLKDFFRLIHDISGLNVVLDPNVRGSLTLVLDDVPWDQALDIVLKNNGLDRQLQGNVLRIATIDTMRREAEARRAQAEAEALAVDKQTVTRFLSYAHSKDVVPTIKKFLSSRGDVIADDRTNALIISDIPSVIPQVDRLLAQLDRKTQEVEIEARVVAATRNFARDIGTQLGFGWGNHPTAAGGMTGTSPITNNNPTAPLFITSPGSTGSIPLFSNLGVPGATSALGLTNATNNYRIDAILTMAESKGLAKILSRPRVVTQNNITAVVKQGFKLPIVTQAQLGGPSTTTFVDAVLRLTVTPQITAEGTIFLAVDVENTTPDRSFSVGNVPALLTQQATTQVLVTDGGTVVIGGVIQTQNSVDITQVPLLGDIPVFGNLFKRRSVSTQTQELIFFITPKIVHT